MTPRTYVVRRSLHSPGIVNQAVLHRALYVPKMKDTRLFSWKRAAKYGHQMYGHGDHMFVLNKEKAQPWARSLSEGSVIQLAMKDKSFAMSAKFSAFEEFHAAISRSLTKPECYLHQEDIPTPQRKSIVPSPSQRIPNPRHWTPVLSIQ